MTPRPAKSFTLRVTTVRSCSRAVAANETVYHLERPSLQLTLPGQHAPAFGNRLVHGRTRPSNQGPQRLIEPLLQFAAALLSESRVTPFRNLAGARLR